MSVINVKEEQSLAEDESELRNEDILDIKYQDIKSEVEQMNYGNLICKINRDGIVKSDTAKTSRVNQF